MKHWLLVTVLLLSPLSVFAKTKEFVREYTYTAGEADSKITARQMAMQEVKRELLNELGTHIYSRIDISSSKDEKVAKQEIRAMTAGFVKVNVLEESWNGYEFHIKAKMAADPKEILKRIKGLASNDQEKMKLKEQLNDNEKAFEALRIEMLVLKKAVAESKSESEKQKLALLYDQSSKELTATELFEKGQDYAWGYKGESINYKKAFYWYQKAAEKGDAPAQYNLGVLYLEGEGVPKSDKKAVYWTQKSADQGDVSAQYNLGLMYYDGKGVPQDYKKAEYWYQKAADLGYASAQYNLGLMYYVGKGVPQSDKKAVYWYQKAADQGLTNGQYNIGHMYSKGKGVPQSDKKAVYWYQKAADQGAAYAQFNLGNMYREGRGVPQDYRQAVYWYQKAADQGVASAQYNLGFIYEDGKGVPQSDKKAVYWYQKAADQGFDLAKKAIQELNGKSGN